MLWITVACVCLFWLPLLLLTIAALLLATYAAYIVYNRRRIRLPCPHYRSFFQGHAGELRLGRRNLDTFLLWAQQCGLTYTFFVYHQVLVVSADHRWLKEILHGAKYGKSAFVYKENLGKLLGKRMLGRGLATNVMHTEWLRHRRILEAAFTRHAVSGYLGRLNEMSERLVKRIEKETECDSAGKFNVHKVFGHAALDIVSNVLLSIDIDALNNPDIPVIRCVDTFLKGQSEYYADPFIKLKPSRRKFVRNVLDSCSELRQFSKDCLTKGLLQSDCYESTGNTVSLILRSRAQDDKPAKGNGAHVGGLSQAQFESAVDEFVTLLVAGHETTSSLMSFTLYLLARNRAAYEKLMEELDSVSSSCCSLDEQAVTQLRYLAMVLNESLRLFPPGSGTVREIPHDLEMFGVRLPKGTLVNLSFYIAHRWPDYFDRPDDFLPERWSNADACRVPCTFVPFASGPRSCIGKHFTLTAVKLLLAGFLLNFEFELVDEELEIEAVGTIRPKQLLIKVRRRNNNNT